MQIRQTCRRLPFTGQTFLHVRAMRNFKRYIILLIAAGILLTSMAAGLNREKEAREKEGQARAEQDTDLDHNRARSVKILPREEFEAAGTRYRTEAFRASSLAWKGSSAACDERSATVYIPCDLQELTQTESGTEFFSQKILSGLEPAEEGGTIMVCSDKWMDDPAGAAAAGHSFEALLADGDGAGAFRIVLTGLPVLCIEKTDTEEITGKEEHTGRIRYIPASLSDEGERGEEYFCRFHVRGNVSSTLEKKPYKVTLTDRAGNKIKGSLADLREDDDWILNPLFTDSTRVREMTAYTLWDRISVFSEAPQASSRMRYAEVFFDNAYQGLYGLMEPVDGKQLALKEGDLLYKIDRWDREYPYLDEYEKNEGRTAIYNDGGFPCVEIRYPKDWDRTASWMPMQAFHTFAIRTQDYKTLSSAGVKLDMDSHVSMSLYCAMTHAMDSTWKNSFLIARKDPEGGYTLHRTIWDLNFVFGDVFIYAPEDGYTVFDRGSAVSYKPLEDSTYDFEACLAADPSAEDLLRQKWAEWREGGIDAESVCEDAERHFSLLKESGALDRETECWPQEKNSGDALREMEEWIRARFAYLDGYFGWTTK